MRSRSARKIAHRINKSTIHIDFMIGSDEVTVTGAQADGTEVPVLRGGDWQMGV